MGPHHRSDTHGSPARDWVLEASATSSDDPTRVAGPADTEATPSSRPARRPIQAGQVLGHYQVIEQLGAGGMGEVYKAVHQTMNRVVALKVLAPHLVEDDRAKRRFKREVLSTSQLSHPNIVMAHDAAEEDGYCFLVMEFVDGIDLGDLVEMFGLPPAHVACQIIKQAAEALQHAHERGLVHRDIKPANLMVLHARPPSTSGGSEAPTFEGSLWPDPPQIKLLDFGLVRIEAPAGEARPAHGLSVTREGVVVGTPEYMAPEQATHGGKVDGRSDIYALGCTFYFLLTGKPPFNTGTVYDILAAQIRLKPEPLVKRRADLPPALLAVAEKMLAKRPEERFQSPAEVMAALERWTSAWSIPAPSSVPPPPAEEPVLPAPEGDAGHRNPLSPVLYPTRRPTRPEPTPGGMTVGAFFALVALVAIAAVTMWALTRPTGPDNESPPVTMPKDKSPSPNVAD